MFGTLKDGVLIPAPKAITAYIEIDGVVRSVRVYNPKPEHYISAGYLEVFEEDYPEIGEGEVVYYTKVYTETGGAIYGEWVECDPPETVEPVPTLEERVTDCENALIELAEIVTEGE